MPRGPRNAPGEIVYHVLNRGVARRTIFHKDADYFAFERVMDEAMHACPTRLLAYCVMPNHWHLVLWPRREGELSDFVGKLTHTHTQRYHAHYHTSGTGHLYQGRFKSFPVQADPHLLLVLRYVERNALRAGLVERAEDWRFSSLWRRERGIGTDLLSDWPVERPADWTTFVDESQTDEELEGLRQSVTRSAPFGHEQWRVMLAAQLGIQSTLRPQGRPRRPSPELPAPSD
jgi:putative transposase